MIIYIEMKGDYMPELNREEFRWRKQKFMIQMAAGLVTVMLIFMSFFYMSAKKNFSIEKELKYVLDRYQRSQYESQKRLEETIKYINKLEVQVRNNEDVIVSLKSDVSTTQELINALSMQLKVEKAAKNGTMDKE